MIYTGFVCHILSMVKRLDHAIRIIPECLLSCFLDTSSIILFGLNYIIMTASLKSFRH